MNKSGGWSEAYRIRFRAKLAEKIGRLAWQENRSIQEMIRTLAREGLFYRLFPQMIAAITEGNYEILDDYIDDGFGDIADRYHRSRISNELRWQIWQRDKFICRSCGSQYMLTVDHIVPVSKGGKPIPENLQTLCKECNAKKGSK